MFEGVYTALITPFRNGSIDYGALEKLVAMQVEGGVDGIVPMGTTGESPTVSFDEHKEFIRRVVGLVKGRVKVIAGTGANSTREAICSPRGGGRRRRRAQSARTITSRRRGLIAHFESVAKSIQCPSSSQHSGRTGVNFLPPA